MGARRALRGEERATRGARGKWEIWFALASVTRQTRSDQHRLIVDRANRSKCFRILVR